MARLRSYFKVFAVIVAAPLIFYSAQPSAVLCRHMGEWERFTSSSSFALLKIVWGLGLLSFAISPRRSLWIGILVLPLLAVVLDIRILEYLWPDFGCNGGQTPTPVFQNRF